MPRVQIRTDCYTYQTILNAELRQQITENARRIVSETFKIEPKDVEVRWATDEETIGASQLTLDVLYTVSENAFGIETLDDAFTSGLKNRMIGYIADHFFPQGTLGSVDVWVRPQWNANWGAETRYEWQVKRV